MKKDLDKDSREETQDPEADRPERKGHGRRAGTGRDRLEDVVDHQSIDTIVVEMIGTTAAVGATPEATVRNRETADKTAPIVKMIPLKGDITRITAQGGDCIINQN